MFYFGPSVVSVLPLTAGTNEGGHYFRYFSLLLLLGVTVVIKTIEGIVVGKPPKKADFGWTKAKMGCLS